MPWPEAMALSWQASDLLVQIPLVKGLPPPNTPESKEDKKLRTRNRRVEIYFTDEELNALKSKVEASGQTREGFCREALLNGVVKPLPPIDFHELVLQFRHIGNNINQVIATAHSQGFIDSLRLREQLDQLWELEQQAAALFTEG